MAKSPVFYDSKVNAKPVRDPLGEDLLSMQSFGGFLSERAEGDVDLPRCHGVIRRRTTPVRSTGSNGLLRIGQRAV